MIIYIIIFVLLLIAELLYFRIANKCNIIDKPNERSSHSTIVLRGGGIIFLIGVWIWSAFFGFQYPWFLVGLTLVAGISFVDDIHSLPDSVRLVAQFSAAAMAFYQLGILHWAMWWIILLALIVYVGATNVIKLHGWNQWHHSGILFGCIGFVGSSEYEWYFCRTEFDHINDSSFIGVLYFQFSSEG